MTLVERLQMIRGTQFTPTEDALVAEAADAITLAIEALDSIRALNQGVCDNDTLAPGQRNFAMLVRDKCDETLTHLKSLAE